MRAVLTFALITLTFGLVGAVDWPGEVLPNQRVIEGDVFVGGQPSYDQLRKMANNNVELVVNLRPTDEVGALADEGRIVRELGMTYRYVPVRDSDDLTLEATTALHRALTVWRDERVVVHCSTGNRVGALFALRAFYFQRATIDEAIEIGRNAGLTTLEPAVRQKLFEHADSIAGS